MFIKKLSVIAIFIAILFSFCACAEKNEPIQPSFDNKEVSSVHISSLPSSESYTRHYTSSETIGKVISYLNGLQLQKDFPENPDEYVGMTWAVELGFENGETKTIYMLGNMFYREDDSDWMRMNYEEANAFDVLVNENPSEK